MLSRLQATTRCASLFFASLIVAGCESNAEDKDAGDSDGADGAGSAPSGDSDSAIGNNGVEPVDDRSATATDDDEAQPGNDETASDDSSEEPNNVAVLDAACRDAMTSALPWGNRCEDCVAVECDPDDGSWSAYLFVNQQTGRCCTILDDPGGLCFWTTPPELARAKSVCGEWQQADSKVLYRSPATIMSMSDATADGCIEIDVPASGETSECRLCERNNFCWFCTSDTDCDCAAFVGFPYEATWCWDRDLKFECEKSAGSSIGLCRMTDPGRFP